LLHKQKSNSEKNTSTQERRAIRQAEQFEVITAALQKELIGERAFTNPLLSLSDVARLVDTNTKYLSRYFKVEAHSNFSSYINRLRVLYSAELLLSDYDLPISEIAQRSGFNSQGIFLRSFRNNFHMTPSIYRQTRGLGKAQSTLSEDPLFPDFSSRLHSAYPALTKKDLHLCYLIFQGVPTEEQAGILGITYGSLLVSRSRLREKLCIGRTDHLDIIINEAVASDENTP